MKRCSLLCAGLLWAASLASAQPAKPATAAQPAAAAGPKIEVCFVLDSTGSMGGLIDGAKRKVWSIANQLLSGKPTPQLRIGLVSYRDRGDAYVTKRFDLSDDLDAVYANLTTFTAGGGGDTPESVNQALAEAVKDITWSTGSDTYRVIFLVGDCPPHMDYKDDVKWPDTVKDALGRDIIVNTVQCGNYGETGPIWRDIALKGEGKYVQIDQSGGMTAIATPYDLEIARLNTEMTKTVVAYGSVRQQAEIASKAGVAAAAPASVAADRVATLGGRFDGAVVSGAGDLVQDMALGRAKLGELKTEELPENMRKMSPAEREAYLKDQGAKRKVLQTQFDELNRKRQTFVDAETKRLAAAGGGDPFDQKVLEMIAVQASRKGISYPQPVQAPNPPAAPAAGK
ncbi:MAG: VWA domain-containing protein [Armatimonadetes bacterium]|nr:VWA domain-containing protein [Armatimonadota bacterium]